MRRHHVLVLLLAALFAWTGCGSTDGSTEPNGQTVDDGVGGGAVDEPGDLAGGEQPVDEPDPFVEPEPEPEPLEEFEWICTRDMVASNPYGRQLPGDLYEATFDLPAGTYSFLLGSFDPGYVSVIESMTMPDGTYQDFLADRDYQNFHVTWQIAGGEVDALLFPPAPDYAWMVQEGEYTVRGLSNSGEFCFYMFENEAPGTRLDVNFYFVDVPGLNSDTAEDDVDWQQVEDEFAEILGQAGVFVDVDAAFYYDIEGDDAERYTYVRSQEAVGELVRLSEDQGNLREDVLSMNIFMIRAFNMGGGGGGQVLGISPGIPGAAGLHGSPSSGVVFATEGMLGRSGWFDGNSMLAQTMAHEVGHFLGLFHTTEIYGGADPLGDTPQCPQSDIQSYRHEACPDYDNLMFPTAGFRDQVTLTSQQIEILVGNPLIKP